VLNQARTASSRYKVEVFVEVFVLMHAHCWRGLRLAGLLWFLLCGCLLGQTLAHPAWGILVNRQGEIYFADVQRNRVWLITTRGTLIPVLSGKHSHALWLDQADNVFGEHVWLEDGHWRSSHWQLTGKEQLIELGAPPAPGAVLLRDETDNIFIVESTAEQLRLLKRTPSGQVTLLAGGPRGYADGVGATARFEVIEAMALGRDGALYLRDRSCLRRVSPQGAVTTVGGQPLAGIPRGPQPRILGLAVDEHGNVFVADTEQSVLRKLSPDGRSETVLDTGWFWRPAGVTLANGELYVLECAPESALGIFAALGLGPYLRVQKLTADNRLSTLATVWGPTTRLLLGALILLAALLSLRRMRRRETRREVPA
jgi:hypothetical protein